MRITVHQYAAIAWLVSAPMVWGPVVASATHPNAAEIVGQGIAVFGVAILAAPLLLRWRTFRRWFCWTDALSEKQRQALKRRDLRAFYHAAADDGYAGRVTPYLWRLGWTSISLMLVVIIVPREAISIEVLAGTLFVPWYPLGVFGMALASVPWKQR